MAVSKERKSPVPVLVALGFLVLLLLLLGLYFENCFKNNVLGVSTFGSSASKDPVVNGETFNFKATIVGDQAGVLNATVLFTLAGGGVMGTNIQGPGQCLKLTDTTGACNNVNVDPNQTVVWTVPVTANSNCSQSGSIALQTRLVATVTTSTSTASVSCVASTGSNATNPPANTNGNGNNNGGGTNTTTSTASKTTTTKAGTKASPTPTPMATNIDLAGLACYKVNGYPLVFILLIIWVLTSGYYFLIRK